MGNQATNPKPEVTMHSDVNPENPTYRMTFDLGFRTTALYGKTIQILLRTLNNADHAPYKMSDRDGKLRLLRIYSSDDDTLAR